MSERSKISSEEAFSTGKTNEREIRAQYGKEVDRYDLLSAEEERELGLHAKNGDEAAINRLIECNLRLVLKIAHSLSNDEKITADLIQEGNIGLMRAAKKFDPDMGTRFATYANRWIEAFIKRYLLNNRSLIKLGTTDAQRAVYSKLGKVERALRKAGKEVTAENIAKEIGKKGVTTEMVAEFLERLRPILSTNAFVSHESEDTFEDNLESPTLSPEKEAEQAETANIIKEIIDGLTDERERAIATEHLLGHKTLAEVGKKFNLSRQRIDQIKKGVVAHIKQELEKRGIHE